MTIYARVLFFLSQGDYHSSLFEIIKKKFFFGKQKKRSNFTWGNLEAGVNYEQWRLWMRAGPEVSDFPLQSLEVNLLKAIGMNFPTITYL